MLRRGLYVFLGLLVQSSQYSCPIPANSATVDSANDRGLELHNVGKYEEAATCFMVALDLEGSSATKEVALENLRKLQAFSLTEQLSMFPYAGKEIPPQDISETWTQLLGLMDDYNITTASELSRLRTPFDVLMLHGQLICQKDEPDLAIRSFQHSLKINPTSDAQLLLGRILLGQGDFEGAYVHLLRAYELLIFSSEELRARQRAHTQNMRTTILFTLQFVLAQVEYKPSHAEQIQTTFCKTVRDLLANGGRMDGKMFPSCGDMLFPSISSVISSKSIWTRIANSKNIEAFKDRGYIKISNIIPEPYLSALIHKHKATFASYNQNQVSYVPHQKRSTITNEELSVFLNMQLAALASAFAGVPVVATYTFSILYHEGGLIRPHTDRHQNEISLSLNLGLSDNQPAWPLYIAPKGKGEESATSVILEVNDGLIYRGPAHVHFRKPLPRGTSMHVIFGYRSIDSSHCNSQ
mmetsp:Transcript_9513/g.14280  ORF Transcript_9513/g.14280 Transcript_9513/m.14280 type:complete len:468 (+) Transcript_9513:140-1543(+)